MKLAGKTSEDLARELSLKSLEVELRSLHEYVDSTDWYVIRQLERSVPVPTEITAERLKVINRINEIKELMKQ